MNISTLSDDEMQKVFLMYCAKLMLQAKGKGHSMAVMEVDPKKVFGLAINHSNPTAGELTIVVAAGPARASLQHSLQFID